MLDEAHQLLLQGGDQVALGMDRLVAGLHQRRLESTPQEWRQWVRSTCMMHPICDLLYTDPYTLRAYCKPRGYAGDAVMLDYIYRPSGNPELDETATRIHHYTTSRHASQGVRSRRDLLSKRIDEIADEFSRPRVLALAAGHLREIEGSLAAQARKLDRFVAIDQDEASLATIQADYGHLGVETICATVMQILSDKFDFSDFHFVYAASLFDYLPQAVAQRLIGRMLHMLAPGGRLLIANFLPAIPDVGYMESFMDWFLRYRTHSELSEIFATTPQNEYDAVELSGDPNESIVFAEVRRH